MADNGAQKRSPSYLLPVEDVNFLMRDELRGIRFALEYEKAELLLRDHRIRSTVIVFGSARIPSPAQAAALSARAQTEAERAEAVMRTRQSVYYEEARRFGRLVSEEGGALNAAQDGWRDHVIATGGGPGIMEAANLGAAEAGAPTIGFNITLPREQQPNSFSTPELTFRFHYFAMRKMHLAMRAAALAVFPGGFGTFDELFELLTLQQTGKASRVPIVLIGGSYWREVVNFEALVAHGMIAERDLDLFDIADDAAEAWALLQRRGLRVREMRNTRMSPV